MLIRNKLNNRVEENIIKLEKRYNFVLPKMYRNFLLKYNGGQTYAEYNVKENNKYYVACFYNIDVFTRIDNQYCYLDERIEQCVFPIATDYYGNEYFVVIEGEKIGQIYFLNPENEKYELVASDLKQFIDGCVTDVTLNVESGATPNEEVILD